MLKKLLHNNSFISLLTNGLLAFFGLVNFGLLARIISKDAFGAWLFFLVLLGLLEMLRSGLLQTAMLKFKPAYTNEDYEELTGSSWLVALLATFVLLAICLIVHGIAHFHAFPSEYVSFPFWLACMLILGLPYNFCLWLFQAESRFKQILLVRTFFQVSFLVYLILLYFNVFEHSISIYEAYALVNILSSLFCLVMAFTKVKSLLKATKATMTKLYKFGRFSMGTQVTSNLLRSSDSFIIGVLLNPAAVASYGIPFRLIELMEMPLRSFVSVFMPKMAHAVALQDGNKEASKLYVHYAGFLTLMFVVPATIIFIFAPNLVVLLSGEAYRSSGILLRILIIYTLFLPLDRLSGVSLDLLGLPEKNFRKVLLMLSVNVLGDYLAIVYLNDLKAVAFVSILTFFTGLWFGNFYLKKEIPYTMFEVIRGAFNFYLTRTKSLFKRRTL